MVGLSSPWHSNRRTSARPWLARAAATVPSCGWWPAPRSCDAYLPSAAWVGWCLPTLPWRPPWRLGRRLRFLVRHGHELAGDLIHDQECDALVRELPEMVVDSACSAPTTSAWKTSRGWSATAGPPSPSVSTGTRSGHPSTREPRSWTASLTKLSRTTLSSALAGAKLRRARPHCRRIALPRDSSGCACLVEGALVVNRVSFQTLDCEGSFENWVRACDPSLARRSYYNSGNPAGA